MASDASEVTLTAPSSVSSSRNSGRSSHRRLLPDSGITVDVQSGISSPSSSTIDTVLADLNRNKDFKFIAAVAKLVLLFLRKFWTACSTCLLVLIALYWLYGGLVTFLLCCAGLLGVLYQVGDLFLYFPNQPPNSRVLVHLPSMYNLPFEAVTVKSQDRTKISCFFIKQPDDVVSKCPTIIYFHGNAGNVGHRLTDAHNMYHSLRCNVFMVEYRGYGKSDGKPSEPGLYMDAQAALNYVTTDLRVDQSRIFVFGRSLGGAVAIELCSQIRNANKIAGLIVENTFTSIQEMGFELVQLHCIRRIPRWLLKNKYESSRKVKSLTLPCLFLSGEADTLVPPSMVDSLHHACGSTEKQLVTFPRGGHNDTWMCPGYYDAILQFIVKALEWNSARSGVADASVSVNVV